MSYKGLELKGRVAVVMGGTSGLGRAIMLALAEAGADVVPTSRRPEQVESAGREAESRGRRTLRLTSDVMDRSSLESVRESVIHEFGHVDILVNAAGRTKRTPTIDLNETEWNDIIGTNLTGTLRACQIFGRPMIEQRYGRIINIGSLTSFISMHEVAAYAASKSGVASLTKTLAIEWAPYGICINALVPGVFHTALNEKLLDGTARGHEFLSPNSHETLWQTGRTRRRSRVPSFGLGRFRYRHHATRGRRFSSQRCESMTPRVETADIVTSNASTASITKPAAAAIRVGHYRWYICALLFFATTVNYVDRQIIGVLAPELQRVIGWNEIQYGWIVASFQAAYAIGFLFAGRFIDRVGTRAGYAIMFSIWSLAAIYHSLVGTVLGFSIARFVLGLGESSNFPAAIKTTAEWFPRKERAFATGIFNAGSNMGAIVAPMVVPWITTRFGWHWAFVAMGLLGVPWLIAWLATTGSYAPVFVLAGSAYLAALAVIHLLAPRLEAAEL